VDLRIIALTYQLECELGPQRGENIRKEPFKIVSPIGISHRQYCECFFLFRNLRLLALNLLKLLVFTLAKTMEVHVMMKQMSPHKIVLLSMVIRTLMRLQKTQMKVVMRTLGLPLPITRLPVRRWEGQSRLGSMEYQLAVSPLTMPCRYDLHYIV